MRETHGLIGGATYSGKSTFGRMRWIGLAMQGTHWLTVVCPHRHDADALVAHLYGVMGEEVLDRLVFERLGDMRRVVMRRIIHRSDHPDPWQRAQENEHHAGAALETLAMRRKLEDLSERPVLEMYSRLAVSVLQNVTEWMPESAVGQLLLPGSPWWLFAVRRCTDPTLRAGLERLADFSPRELRDIIWPVVRFVEASYAAPCNKARTSRPPRWDRPAFLNAGGIYVVDGSGVSKDALRAFVGADMRETMELAKAGLEMPGRYVLEEALNYGLCGPECVTYLSVMSGFGVGVDLVVQYLDFPTPEIRGGVLQNTSHYFFRQGDPDSADIAAKALRGAYDRFKVHHTDLSTRQVHRGYEEVDQWQRGESYDQYGNATGTNSRRGTGQRAVYGEQTDSRHVYEAGQDQQFWQAADLQQLAVGECMVNERGSRPYRLQVPMLEDPWHFEGLAEEKAEECATLIRDRLEIFEAPQVVTAPAIPAAPPTSAGPTKPAPKPQPKGGRNGRNGMKPRRRS